MDGWSWSYSFPQTHRLSPPSSWCPRIFLLLICVGTPWYYSGLVCFLSLSFSVAQTLFERWLIWLVCLVKHPDVLQWNLLPAWLYQCNWGFTYFCTYPNSVFQVVFWLLTQFPLNQNKPMNEQTSAARCVRSLPLSFCENECRRKPNFRPFINLEICLGVNVYKMNCWSPDDRRMHWTTVCFTMLLPKVIQVCTGEAPKGCGAMTLHCNCFCLNASALILVEKTCFPLSMFSLLIPLVPNSKYSINQS